MESYIPKVNFSMCMGLYKRIHRKPRKPTLPVKVHMSTGHPFEVLCILFSWFSLQHVLIPHRINLFGYGKTRIIIG